MPERFLPTLLSILALFGCAEGGNRAQELDYLRVLVPDPLLDCAHLEVGSAANVAVLGETGAKHLGLRVFPGQNKVNKGMRAEVSVDYPHAEGETVRYAWRFMLPRDFVSDAPKNRWWIIGQWHDQPDLNKGESWKDFISKSPPVLLGLGELDGHLGIGLTYGPSHADQKQRAMGPVYLERGRWHHIAVVIHWSRGLEGSAALFLDDMSKAALSAEGPNMNNAYRHFLKLGMYRHPDIATDNWIYLDDLEISVVGKP